MCPIVAPCPASHSWGTRWIGRDTVKPVECAPRETSLPGQRPFRRFDLPLTSSLAADRRGAFCVLPGEPSQRFFTLLMSFSDLGLEPGLMRAVAEKGYATPTPIQRAAIP